MLSTENHVTSVTVSEGAPEPRVPRRVSPEVRRKPTCPDIWLRKMGMQARWVHAYGFAEIKGMSRARWYKKRHKARKARWQTGPSSVTMVRLDLNHYVSPTGRIYWQGEDGSFWPVT